MSGRARVRTGILVSFAALLAACGAAPDAHEAPAAASRVVVWDTLGSWSGRTSRQTESFEFTSGPLRLTWEAHAQGAAVPGHFRVTLHSSISGRPLVTVAEVEGTGADTVEFSAEPHVAYLRVESEGVQWRMTLEEGSPGVR